MTEMPSVKSFPTIRAQMGDWFYYLTTLPFYEVARRVLPATQFFHPSSLNKWIQRDVMPRRRIEIAEYLINQPERFFNGIVVGVYQGEPKWYNIEVDENNIFGTSGMDARFEKALGILQLSGEERLYAIDGQHRVAGIKEALDRLRSAGREEEYITLANEDLGIVIVAADVEAGHLQRIRRMFSTLNKTARPVSTAELIALDEDDASAIVTRRLATEFEELNKVTQQPGRQSDMGLIHLGKSTHIPRSNHHSITTIVTLLDIVRSAFKAEVSFLKNRYTGNRPKEENLDSLYDQASQMWLLLKEHCLEMGEVMGSEPAELLASKFRRLDGGHVLFRPIGQQAFSGALGVLRARGISTEDAIAHLCLAPMELSRPPWLHVMWNPITNRMVNSYRVLAEALFLHMVGARPRTTGYDVIGKYRELHGETDAPVELIPVTRIR